MLLVSRDFLAFKCVCVSGRPRRANDTAGLNQLRRVTMKDTRIFLCHSSQRRPTRTRTGMSVRKCVGLMRLPCLLVLVGAAVAWASEMGARDESRRRVIAPTASPWAEESVRDHALVSKSDGISERRTGEGGMSARQRLKDVGTSRQVPGSNVAGAAITVDVHASSAPNAFGSPSWAGYVVNALQALENNLSTNGNRATDPTGYERAPSQIPPGEIAVSSFNSWRGVVSPALNAPYSGVPANDGNAWYNALSRFPPNPTAMAMPGGLLVTTFRFRVLSTDPTQVYIARSCCNRLSPCMSPVL